MPKQNHTIHFIIVYPIHFYCYYYVLQLLVMPCDERDIKSHKVKTILLYEINSIDERE